MKKTPQWLADRVRECWGADIDDETYKAMAFGPPEDPHDLPRIQFGSEVWPLSEIEHVELFDQGLIKVTVDGVTHKVFLLTNWKLLEEEEGGAS